MRILSKLKRSMLALKENTASKGETGENRITVTISGEQGCYIREKVNGGLYVNESDVVRDALRFLKLRDENSGEDDDFESPQANDEASHDASISVLVGISNSEVMSITCEVMRKLGLVGWNYHALVGSRAFDEEPSSFDQIAPDLHFWFVDLRSQKHSFCIRMELLEFPVTFESWLSAQLEAKLREIITFLSWYDRDAHIVNINL